MTKYHPTHEIVKELGIKGGLAQMMDSAIDHIGNVMNNSNPKDVLHIAIFIIGTWYSYNEIAKVKATLKQISFTGFIQGLTMGWAQFITLKTAEAQPDVNQSLTPEGFDMGTLAQAMLATYMVMKVSIDDVKSAVSAISGAIAKVG